MTKMNYDVIVKAVNEITRQYTIKLTLRQIYYRLVAQNLIPNTKSSYKGLSSMLVRAREERKVDEDKIEDRSRQVLGSSDYGYDSPDDFMEAMIKEFQGGFKYYNRKLWDTQETKLAIALEKDALSRLFLQTIEPYRMQLFPTRGYGSFTYVRTMAKELRSEQPVAVLYFGDFDPSGQDIERDLRERLARYGARNIVEVKRIALTVDQINEYKLPPMPDDAETLAKLRRDTRAAKYGLDYAVELDALEPPVLQRLIEDEILSRIDKDSWDDRKEEIEDEREDLKIRLQKFKEVSE